MLRPFTKLAGLAAYCQSAFCETYGGKALNQALFP
jgi:hypothetical protein